MISETELHTHTHTHTCINTFLYHCKEVIYSKIELTINWSGTVQKYYKSRAVGITFEVGLTTDRNQETKRLLFLLYTGSHMVRATIQHIYVYTEALTEFEAELIL